MRSPSAAPSSKNSSPTTPSPRKNPFLLDVLTGTDSEMGNVNDDRNTLSRRACPSFRETD